MPDTFSRQKCLLVFIHHVLMHNLFKIQLSNQLIKLPPWNGCGQTLDVQIYGVLKAKSRTFWKKQRLMDTNMKPSICNAITRLCLSISFINKDLIQDAFKKACKIDCIS